MRILYLLFFVTANCLSQIAIGENDTTVSNNDEAILIVESKSDGILIPTFTKQERESLEIPEDGSWEGMIVYDTTFNTIAYIGKDNTWQLTLTEKL